MNNYFQFKQFRIDQDNCAMKVSTDACLFGAWVPVAKYVKTVLDIGGGTGLLSLMLAQKNKDIYIDAIELNLNASQQANTNFTASPWSNRLRVIHADIKEFVEEHKYDMIICNPPFFQNSLLGSDNDRNIARHTRELEYSDIIKAMEMYLTENGYATILLPAAEHKVWQELLKRFGWYVNTELRVRPLPHKPINRIMSICSRQNESNDIHEICIYKEQGKYSDEFIALLKPFYLQL